MESLKQRTVLEWILEPFVRCGLCVPLFTEKQKLMILTASQMECPADLYSFVYVAVSRRAGTHAHSHA